MVVPESRRHPPQVVGVGRGLIPPNLGSEPGSLIDTATVAARLGVTERFVRRLVDERRIPFLKIGKFVRFDPDEIAEWIDEQRVAAQ